MNNKDSVSIIDIVIIIISLICFLWGIFILIITSSVTMNQVNIYNHRKEAAHIEIDENLTFDGYEWNDSDLILHYKEK